MARPTRKNRTVSNRSPNRRRKRKFKLTSIVQALIIEAIAVSAILALFISGRAELQNQMHTELREQKTSQLTPRLMFQRALP